jgi:hypothetical protein
MTQRYSQLKNEIHHLEEELKDATPIYQEVIGEKLKTLYAELKPFEAEATMIGMNLVKIGAVKKADESFAPGDKVLYDHGYKTMPVVVDQVDGNQVHVKAAEGQFWTTADKLIRIPEGGFQYNENPDFGFDDGTEAKAERAKAIASRLVTHGIKVTVSMEPHEGETVFARQLREALVGRR